MNQIAKHAYFALVVSLTLTTAATVQSETAQSETDKSVKGSGDNVDLSSMDIEAQTEHFRQEREALADDPLRPLYHFSRSKGMLHDPTGLCWWQGKYHLFYLARGHAVSDDLVHWQDLPMMPTSMVGGTGQVWADGDRVIMGWASGKHDAISLATASDPLLVDWALHPENPVYGPSVLQPGNDNYLWREGDTYYMTVRKTRRFEPGLSFLSGGPTALDLLRCQSSDLATWKWLGTFLEDTDYTQPGDDCACNNVLPIGGGKHLILWFSHRSGAQYYVGTFDREKGRFHIENHGLMNFGDNYRGGLHAPSGFVDPKGRLIGMWNIVDNWPQEGWKEIMSLPRQLSLIEKDSFKFPKQAALFNPLGIEPIAELESLRFDPVRIKDVVIPANGEKVLSGVNGKAMELELVIDPMKAREVGIKVLRSPNGEEETTITLFNGGLIPWEPGSPRQLAIDVSRASLDPDVRSRSPEMGYLYLEDGKPLRLRVFIDRSIVEVFANGRQSLTLRCCPTRKDSTGVSVFARGREARLVSLNAYQMRSIWPELKDQEGK